MDLAAPDHPVLYKEHRSRKWGQPPCLPLSRFYKEGGRKSARSTHKTQRKSQKEAFQ